MRNKAVMALTLFLILSLSPMFSDAAISPPSANKGDYVIFRAQIAPYYIENQSVQIRVYALVFRDNKPSSESSQISIEIEGINIAYSYKSTIEIQGGRLSSQYLPALREGHYKITLYAQKDNMKSETVAQDFGVTKAPVPYEIHCSADGSKAYFRSHQLDPQGRLDANYTFRLEVYYYQHGAGEALVMTLTNITNATITINPAWKNGIVYIDVIDRWGWRNSATMDLNNLQFAGIPLSYDYEYSEREPYKSHNVINFLGAGIVLVFLLGLAYMLVKPKNPEGGTYER